MIADGREQVDAGERFQDVAAGVGRQARFPDRGGYV
jgi:hypothetical protein